MPRKLPDGTIFFSIQYSESSRSNELGWVTARFTTSSETSDVYWTVKPRSALHLSASSLNWLTPVPAIRKVTASAAWTNGNPVIAPAPNAQPAVAAVFLRNRRRDVVVLVCMPSSLVCLSPSHVQRRRSSLSPHCRPRPKPRRKRIGRKRSSLVRQPNPPRDAA